MAPPRGCARSHRGSRRARPMAGTPCSEAEELESLAEREAGAVPCPRLRQEVAARDRRRHDAYVRDALRVEIRGRKDDNVVEERTARDGNLQLLVADQEPPERRLPRIGQ